MACPDCGSFHHDSSSSEDSDDCGGEFIDDSSSSDDDDDIPFMPPFLGAPHLLVPNFNDMFPLFPFGNPLQLMVELQRFHNQMNREQMRTKRDEERNRKRQLGSIAKTSFSKKQEVNEKQCVICLEEFEEGIELKRLSCKHHYHSSCIDKWLIQNGKCPLCNSKAVNTLEEVQGKFTQAKRLREKAQNRMRKKPKKNAIKARRMEEIKKNPANANGRKLTSKKKRRDSSSSFLRRRRSRHSSGIFLPGIFGGILPPPIPSYGGAMDSDEESEQIQLAIRESLKEVEEIDKKEKESEDISDSSDEY